MMKCFWCNAEMVKKGPYKGIPTWVVFSCDTPWCRQSKVIIDIERFNPKI